MPGKRDHKTAEKLTASLKVKFVRWHIKMLKLHEGVATVSVYPELQSVEGKEHEAELNAKIEELASLLDSVVYRIIDDLEAVHGLHEVPEPVYALDEMKTVRLPGWGSFTALVDGDSVVQAPGHDWPVKREYLKVKQAYKNGTYLVG